MPEYDVIVIGARSAGWGNAGVAHTIGLRTLLIEKGADHFGGACTNFGCVPSKSLIHLAKKFHGANKAKRFGLQVSGKAIMKEVLDYYRKNKKLFELRKIPKLYVRIDRKY